MIGCGGRSGQVLTSFAQVPNNTFVAACDVFKERLDAMAQRLAGETGQKVDSYGDYRRVLDRKDIDALLVGTPDHWHPQMVIDACAAGKDVYLDARTVPVGVELEAIVVATRDHAANFLDCVRSRRKPVCDVEVGFYSTLPCLLGLLAMRERRAYTWDAINMTAKPV